MAQIPLSLSNQDPQTEKPEEPQKSPVMGWFAVAFGLLGIFTIGFIFVPLGLICSVIALFTGQAMWGFIGIQIIPPDMAEVPPTTSAFSKRPTRSAPWP